MRNSPRSEAVDTLRREREAIALLRAECEAVEERLQDALEQARAAERIVQTCQEQLAEERQARKNAEKALRIAETARDAAEQLVRTLSEEIPAPRQAAQPAPRPRVVAERDVAVVPVRRGRVPETVAAEPEPVKWWLNTKPTGKKR